MPITVKCDNCKKEERVCPSLVKKVKHHFCSTKCRKEYYVEKRRHRTCTDCNIKLELGKNYYISSQNSNYHICNTCMGKRGTVSRYKNREAYNRTARERKRRTMIKTTNGVIHNLNKRTFPETGRCEICGKKPKANLAYHHWDDNNPSLGIWCCFKCHMVIERIDDHMLTKINKHYLLLKEQIIKNAHYLLTPNISTF